ncbi:sensor histidine kinase [Rhizobium leguminosarum]|uniref:sensor histidine kinase n=1 Tax=Rhizobium leguminosarum TaxID=384 RepID=UPI00140F9391|nr:sensor histidine kinase [Rhizobium leguminosarum]QIO61583.1 sensor histidine kinase [Rhizobium leguminosarum bv. trifolii]
MAFKFAARTLLELGKELISSDEVAIYELIKNGVDAGSDKVEIEAQILITQTTQQTALERFRANATSEHILEFLQSNILPGASPAAAAAYLRSLQTVLRPRTRFGQRLLSAYRRHNWIEVRDTGHGMTILELDEVFLTVGTRSRREANVGGAQFLGDKGVGRLSTMRLGDHLSVVTSQEGELHWHKLRVDWREFGHDVEKSVSEIAVEPREGDRKIAREAKGTTIRISNLLGDWTNARFHDLFQGRIARMVDPFQPGKANQLLRVIHNAQRVSIPSVPKRLLEGAHAVCKASFSFVDGQPTLTGTIDYRLREKQRPIAQSGPEIYSIAQNTFRRRGKRGHAATAMAPIRPKALQDLGPFEVEVYWYNRRVVEAIDGLTSSMADTRAEIARWSGGPMLYRHGYRILPYGDPDDDWLELDKNAFGQAGFKLNRQQVIGKVSVESAHTALSEQTNREGLVRSESSEALTTILKWLLHGEMRELINDADKEEQLSKRQAEQRALAFRDTQLLVQQSLDVLRREVALAQRPLVDHLAEQIDVLSDQCEALVGGVDKVIREAVDDREKFVHLAGIGLMTEFIFHELDRAVDSAMRAIRDAQGATRESVLASLEAQLASLQKRVSAFDELTGEKRQTKKRFNVSEVIKLVLDNHQNEFGRHGIAIEVSVPADGLQIKAVKGMLIQIMENLVANSVYWLKQQVRYEPNFKPKLTVTLDPEDECILVEDNGPGIDPARRDVIFHPFISSKPPGEGRGLGLYISQELAKHHDWQIYLDPAVGKIRPGRLNKFIVDFGGAK